jgi:preprotein translocase subunit YajC
MLLIFYVLVLLPMRRRQRKVQEFQSSLKVGDKVILTSGIHGQITRVAEGTVQVQIADRVRIEVSRAAVGGYQGQEPVVQSSGNL